ncbi:hypothetical protein Bca4012_082590 [Brassica carinata]
MLHIRKIIPALSSETHVEVDILQTVVFSLAAFKTSESWLPLAQASGEWEAILKNPESILPQLSSSSRMIGYIQSDEANK